MSTDGHRAKWRKNIAENFNRLSRAHERCRQATDDRRQTDGRTGDDIANVNAKNPCQRYRYSDVTQQYNTIQ